MRTSQTSQLLMHRWTDPLPSHREYQYQTGVANPLQCLRGFGCWRCRSPDSEEEFDVGINQLLFDIMKLDYFRDGLKGR